MAEALESAISDVGYSNINGDEMRKVMETITDCDPLDMGVGYTWTPTDHQGNHVIKWCEWTENGTKVSISDWWKVPDYPEEQRSDSFFWQ